MVKQLGRWVISGIGAWILVCSSVAAGENEFPRQPLPIYRNPYGMPVQPMFPRPGFQNPRPSPGGTRYFQPRQHRPFPNWPPNRPAPKGFTQPGPNPPAPAKNDRQYSPPGVVAWISEQEPFVQQSLLYKVTLISDGALQTASPEVPGGTAYIVQSLGGAVVRRAVVRGRQKTLHEYRYLLMPMKAGDLAIAPPRVRGTHAGPQGAVGPAFSVQGLESIQLQVKPARGATDHWLPLYKLGLRAYVKGNAKLQAGHPFRLVFEIAALGMTGNQLPSVRRQLTSDDFQIYRDDVTTHGDVGKQDATLRGIRTETFVLVPKYGGSLRLPAVRMNWWNVRAQRAEVAAVPGLTFRVAGPPRDGGEGETIIARHRFNTWGFWLPMMAGGLLVLSFWVWAWFGPRPAGLPTPLATVLVRGMQAVFGERYPYVQARLRRLSPQRHVHRLRTWIGRNLPVSWKLWFCLRSVESEDDPSEWAQALQILAAKHLGVPANASLARLGAGIAQHHPGAGEDAVALLMHELDEAVYAAREMADFPGWKKRFKSQIEPRLVALLFSRAGKPAADSRARATLPKLNPL